jgi:hypothetical protein
VPILGAIDSGLRSGRATAGGTLAISGAKFDVGRLALQFCATNRSMCVQGDPPTVINANCLTVDVPELPQDGPFKIWASNWGGTSQSSLQFTYFGPVAGDPSHPGRCTYCELVRAHTSEDMGVLQEINKGASDRALAVIAASLMEIHFAKLIKQDLYSRSEDRKQGNCSGTDVPIKWSIWTIHHKNPHGLSDGLPTRPKSAASTIKRFRAVAITSLL